MIKTLFLIVMMIAMVSCDDRSENKVNDGIFEKRVREDDDHISGNVIFEEVDGETEIVAQVGERFAFVRSKGSNERNGHFGGNLIDCSNSEFYCIDGLIATSFPKLESKVEWTFNGYKCAKDEYGQDGELKIKCVSSEGNRTTSATLSKEGGIVEFGSQTGNVNSDYRTSEAGGFPFIG